MKRRISYRYRSQTWLRPPDSPARSRHLRARRLPTSQRYDDFDFGDPPPTRKQFGYAVSLGVDIEHGTTKHDVSDAIDYAKTGDQPATEDQLATIREYHGVLKRAVTRAEADQAIEFLEDHYMPCPFCRSDICATDDECCACGRKLNKLRLPLKLGETKAGDSAWWFEFVPISGLK